MTTNISAQIHMIIITELLDKYNKTNHRAKGSFKKDNLKQEKTCIRIKDFLDRPTYKDIVTEAHN